MPVSLRPTEAGRTLCGEPVVVPVAPPSKQEWCWPTCPPCDGAWRAHEGIPPFPRPRAGTASGTARTSDPARRG